MNKKVLPAIYSAAVWCLFVVLLFFWLYCVTTVTPFIERSEPAFTSFYERSNSGTKQTISAKQNQNIKEALTGASSILNISRENREVVLKPKQEKAIYSFLHRRDVMEILSTGFGKSMIFAKVNEEISSSKTCMITTSSLKSTIDDHISEMLSLSCTAMDLMIIMKETVNLLRESPPQFSLLLGALHRTVSAIVVDESNTVEERRTA